MRLKTIEKVAFNLIRDASIFLPEDVKVQLRKALDRETNSTAKVQLEVILRNVELAEKLRSPICQDTGTVTFFVELGSTVSNLAGIETALYAATRKATSQIPLRPNAVNSFTGLNSGDNTGRFVPCVHWESSENNGLELTVMLKGGGSENVSTLGMLTPTEGINCLKTFVIDSVIRAGAQPCPPTIIGVAAGGGADVALKLAKKALLKPLGKYNPEPRIAELEEELLAAVNMTGIGPMGLGGDTTTLGVHVDYAHRHPASFPVAVVFNCWAHRKASAQIVSDVEIRYLDKRTGE